jgi:hypothetical protein
MSMALPRIAWARTAIALLQGLALSELYQAFENRVWPATDGLVFAPLLAVAIFVPVILLSGLSNLRPRTLAVWIIAAALLWRRLRLLRHLSRPNFFCGFKLRSAASGLHQLKRAVAILREH